MANVSLFMTDKHNKTYEFPMTPEEYLVSSDGGNEKIDVISLGEVNRLSPGTKLNSISLDLIIPVDLSKRRAYWTGKKLAWTTKNGGDNYVNLLKTWHTQKEIVRLVLSGVSSLINGEYIIDGLDYGFQNGNVDEWTVTLTLTAWRSYAPLVLKAKPAPKKPTPKAPAPNPRPQVRVSSSRPRPNPPAKIGVGSRVILNGRVYLDSYGNGGGMTFSNRRMVVTLVAAGRAMPYNVAPNPGQYTGWVRPQDIRLI